MNNIETMRCFYTSLYRDRSVQNLSVAVDDFVPSPLPSTKNSMRGAQRLEVLSRYRRRNHRRRLRGGLGARAPWEFCWGAQPPLDRTASEKLKV